VDPRVNKKAATEHNRDAQSQNIVPASQGGQDPSSPRPTQDLDAAYAAEADDRAKKYFGKEVSAERQAQTTVGQARIPPIGTVKTHIRATRQFPPNSKESAILKEKEAELVALFEHGNNWEQIGTAFSVRPEVAKWEWHETFERNHPETRALRRSWMQKTSRQEQRDAKTSGSSKK
jgi:hypothetical protein